MYHEHFGLDEPPFRNTPDTRVFYSGSKRGAILEAMEYALLQGEGILKVVGEVGSGKTMLCRMLESRLAGKMETVFIANPSLTPDTIIYAIAVELNVTIAEKNDRFQVLQSLQRLLLKKHAEGRHVVVLVEEAQGMPLATLEEIRLLSNLETTRAKLLQLVLFGQPELDLNLAHPSIRQLKERIAYQFDLPRFSPKECEEYLGMRMRAAGYRGPTLFSPKTCRAICKQSEGLTRRINMLADKALMCAYIDKKDQVTPRHVRQATKENRLTPLSVKRRITPLILLLALTTIAIAGMTGFYLANRFQTETITATHQTVINTPPEKATPETRQEPEVAKQPDPQPSSTPPQEATPETRQEPGVAKQPDPQPSSTPPQEATPESLPPPLPEVKPRPVPPSPESTSAHAISGSKETFPPLTSDELRHLLEQKLNATNQWLKTADAKHYTLQITRLPNRLGTWLQEMIMIETHLKGRLFIRPTTVNGQSFYTIYYNDYASEIAARQAIEHLPQRLRQFHPVIQRVAQVMNPNGPGDKK